MRPAKASPLGRGVTEGDGEGKPGRKEPLRSDRQALCQSDAIAVQELFISGLALSVGLAPASSPRGGAIGRPGNFRLDAESPTGRKRAGLAYGDSGFWTSVPCQAAAGLDSGALPFPRHCASLVQWKPDRHARGSPSGGAVERSETERATVNLWKMHE